MKKKIAVFAGNECVPEKEKYYYSVAFETGKLLAENKFITVTGGGPGLMNEVMKGAYEAGGETIGIRLNVPGRKHSEYVTRTYMYYDLVERQNKLLEVADGFLSLPGGVGTFFELFAVIALKRKGEMSLTKPLILIDSFYNEFEILMGKMYEEGFAEKKVKEFYKIVNTPKEAIEILL